MIQATKLKRGMCIKHNGDLYRVVEAQHKTPGNLRGMVQAKIRNLKSGSISDHRFRSVDMVERAILDDTEMEFLYQDGDMYHFMNNETYEQIGLSDEVLGEEGDAAGAVRELTAGRGVDVVFDFVGTDETHQQGLQMVARRGVYSVIGYGGTISLPSVGMIATEMAIAGNLVGNWIDLWELLHLHGRGEITLRTETHSLDDVNEVLGRLRDGDVTGRAVLVP